MSNLGAQQLVSIASGQPIRQVWTIRGVAWRVYTVSYQDTVIDDGVFAGPGSMKRVIRPGSRKHAIWNPHPMEGSKPKAVRYSIEVDNSDGIFHRRAGSVWGPAAYLADPAECFLLHSLYVYIPDKYSPSWSPIPHMDFIGQVVSVEYSGGASQIGLSPLSGAVPYRPASNTATITCEQVGAETALRRAFGVDDADREMVTDTVGGDVGYVF